MFACALILLLFLPAAFLPVALGSFLSSGEMTEMGIQLEETEPQKDFSAAGFTCPLDQHKTPLLTGEFSFALAHNAQQRTKH